MTTLRAFNHTESKQNTSVFVDYLMKVESVNMKPIHRFFTKSDTKIERPEELEKKITEVANTIKNSLNDINSPIGKLFSKVNESTRKTDPASTKEEKEIIETFLINLTKELIKDIATDTRWKDKFLNKEGVNESNICTSLIFAAVGKLSNDLAKDASLKHKCICLTQTLGNKYFIEYFNKNEEVKLSAPPSETKSWQELDPSHRKNVKDEYLASLADTFSKLPQALINCGMDYLAAHAITEKLKSHDLQPSITDIVTIKQQFHHLTKKPDDEVIIQKAINLIDSRWEPKKAHESLKNIGKAIPDKKVFMDKRNKIYSKLNEICEKISTNEDKQNFQVVVMLAETILTLEADYIHLKVKEKDTVKKDKQTVFDSLSGTFQNIISSYPESLSTKDIVDGMKEAFTAAEKTSKKKDRSLFGLGSLAQAIIDKNKDIQALDLSDSTPHQEKTTPTKPSLN